MLNLNSNVGLVLGKPIERKEEAILKYFENQMGQSKEIQKEDILDGCHKVF